MNSATHVLVEKRGETPPLNPLALRTGTIHHRETRTSAMSWTHVRFETSVGNFTVELYYKHAPRTCHNFAELARSGYYNGTIFHRIIKDFMIQGGDPTGTGRGGESIYGGKFEDEITRDLKHTGAGVVSMANAGPNTNGSQFFLTLGPTPWLDGKHTIFGRISHGMPIVQKLGLVKTGEGDRPLTDVRVFKATPLTGPPVQA
ncbi:peptidyl-prolyl cis-trans isomerase ppi1 [Nannochloropsis gaditana]|uniref:Peptidyl-prolyl cis-trans isomerase n=1 Tax=Nannochloropsis gaditana TaxID=72520 RepID=W7U6L7_9STRA|nr:peptidyl-prolyl cis-trans isomerase ppi1 [Nannochloropsis gaditana]